jgi:hypothetical protein
LQSWETQIKGLVKFDETEERLAYDIDDFDLDMGDGVLRPILASPESSSNVADRRSQVGDNPTGTSLTLLVSENVPLNEKQRLVVERVLSSALTWTRHPLMPPSGTRISSTLGAKVELARAKLSKLS